MVTIYHNQCRGPTFCFTNHFTLESEFNWYLRERSGPLGSTKL